MKYINKTPKRGLLLRSDIASGGGIHAYIDASYAVHPDAKSQSGMVISLGRGAIHFESSKQKVIAKSSTEAEIIALSDGISQVIWTHFFLQAQGYHQLPPPTVYQDNMSGIEMIGKKKPTGKAARHINIRRLWVEEREKLKEIKIQHLPTTEMISDLLTKPLQGALFHKFANRIAGYQEI